MTIFGAVSFILFAAAVLIFYCIEKKKIKIGTPQYAQSGADTTIYFILGAALAVRLVLAPMIEGFSSDIGLFRFWSQQAAKDLTGLYSGKFFLDYPPFYMYFLFVIGKIAAMFGLKGGEPAYLILLKLPSIAADIGTGYLLYKLAKDRLPGFWPHLVAAIYVFNPAVVVNSTVWGQVDSFLVFFLALGFVMLSGSRPYLSGIAFAMAALTKPQGLIFLPVVLYELIKRKDIKLILKTAFCGIAAGIAIILPFALKQGPAWIFNLYFNTAEGYKYVTLNAFNFFALIGKNLVNDSETFFIFSYNTWGFIFIFASLVFTAVLYIKGKGSQLPYMAAFILSLGVFMLSVRMHERYMFPVMFFILAVVILTKDRRGLILYVASSFTVFVNTYVVLYKMIKTGYPHVHPGDAEYTVLLIISAVNTVLLIAALFWSWSNSVRQKAAAIELQPSGAQPVVRSTGTSGIFSIFKTGSNSSKFTEEEYAPLRINKKDILVMSVMTTVYLAIAFVNLGSFVAPVTEWAAQKNNEGFIIDLQGEKQVSRLTYYVGLGEGTYNVSYLGPDGVYKPLEKIDDDNFYKWKVLPVDAVASKIKVTAGKPGGMLKEIAVFGSTESELLPVKLVNLDGTPVTEGSLLNLTDEQDKARYRHSYITDTYFDEIYHARTAYEHLNKIKPYEWTHPPFGKILISIGIAIFGMNAFGWRIIGMLFGAAMIPVMYLFGKKLFRQSFFGFCAAFVMMFDLMHFAQTRIATIDGYTTFFVILMYYFMADYYLQKSYKKSFIRSIVPLFLSGLFFGLGAATKWSAMYGAPGLAVIFFMAKYNEYKDYKAAKRAGGKEANAPWVKRFIPVYMYGTLFSCVLFFIVIPAAIYFLSYIPYLMVPGMKVSDILQYQKSMYHYHSTLKAGHSFASEWWSWPLIVRPIWYFQGKDLPSGYVSTIASFGNPAVWWAGILAVLISLRDAVKGSKTVILLVVAAASQYLPWALISRASFIYHFFPILPFVMLCIVYVIKKLLDAGVKKNYIYGYLLLVMLLFFFFYPAVSGMLVPKAWINILRWFPSWVF